VGDIGSRHTPGSYGGGTTFELGSCEAPYARRRKAVSFTDRRRDGALWSSVALADLAGTSVAAADKYDLQEIVVTAEKRSSTVQKTPINMTAISGQDLQDRVRSASI
jgi:outer membrane receptor protein involved in Fe transport